MIKKYDVCVVGGGAAGMAAAIAAAENGCSVCIVEKNKKLGKKMYATGNGRCNLANADTDQRHYHSSSADYKTFLHCCMGDDPNQELFSFLHTIGVYERLTDGYYYPISMQASAVVWAFLDKIRTLPIQVQLGQTVNKISKQADGYCVLTEKEQIAASRVILACGGRAYPSLGGCDCGSVIADALGIKQEAQRPALCAFYTKEDTESIKGVRVTCAAMFEKRIETYQEQGELQITEYGLSGIMIFNLSSVVGAILMEQSEVLLHLDFLPQTQIQEFLSGARQMRSIYGYLNAYMPDKLAMYILKSVGQNPKQNISEISETEIQQIYQKCKAFPFHVRALKDYEQAQVTAGGIRLEAVSPDTMECLQYPGLYVTGEMLDIDGDCGGYNLTFALLTGLRAGRACHDKN